VENPTKWGIHHLKVLPFYVADTVVLLGDAVRVYGRVHIPVLIMLRRPMGCPRIWDLAQVKQLR
jgi:hypothetical protein